MSNNRNPEVLPFADPSRTLLRYKSDFLGSALRVFESRDYILGGEVEAFEVEFGKYLGDDSLVVSCANGTDALYLAIQALNLPPNSTIATTANVGFYSSSAIYRAGHRPFYMDVDISTGSAVLSEIVLAIKAGVEAVVVTHLFGLPSLELEAIVESCFKAGVRVIEDCAQAHGAKVNGRKVGTFGDIAAFSFYPSKNLGAIGDGGAVVSRSSLLAERVKSLRQYGWHGKYQVEMAGGINSRLDELQASFLRITLRDLDKLNGERKAIADFYLENISNERVELPCARMHANSVWHLFVVQVNEISRPSFQLALANSNIGTAIHYPTLDSDVSAYRNEMKRPDLVSSRARLGRIVTLPLFPGLGNVELEKVVRVINEWN